MKCPLCNTKLDRFTQTITAQHISPNDPNVLTTHIIRDYQCNSNKHQENISIQSRFIVKTWIPEEGCINGKESSEKSP